MASFSYSQRMTNLNMKTNLVNTLARSVVTAALLFALPVLAGKAPQVEALKRSLKAVPVLELPAKAAQMVSDAKADERESVALAVVVAVAQFKPAALVSVVGAIVRVAPEMASSIAKTAAKQQPKQASAIAQAAVAAAPGQADKIVVAVSPKPEVAANAETPQAGPPVVGAPFTIPPESPTEIGRGNTVVVAPGGSRDYASP